MTTQDIRLQELTTWANAEAQRINSQTSVEIPLQPVSGDASFRRYYRLTVEGAADKETLTKNATSQEPATFIAVDAPPAHEDSQQFVKIANLLRDAGVSAPSVYAADYHQGFMLLQDFGDALYLEPLLQAQAGGDTALPGQLYRDAITALVSLQQGVDATQLPPYDRERLITEMALFETWFCQEFLGLSLRKSDSECIANAFQFLAAAALAQPQVAVHRDYHSRNLLVLDEATFDKGANPGIIDFQDAVAGAYTYDLVSLLRDCYISWDNTQVLQWALSYRELAAERGLFPAVSEAQFLRDFDLMGLQRHLKVMGIFSRLFIRDGKSRYLADIPLVIRYFLDVSEGYEELLSFRHWFTQTVLPVARTRRLLDLTDRSEAFPQ